MNTHKYPLTFNAADFAKSFDTKVNNFSNELKKKIVDLDFRYRFPTNDESEKLIHEALLKIDSDQQINGAVERKEVWFNGWNENLQMYRESGFKEESLTPKYVRAGNPIRLNKKFFFPADDNFELNFIEIYRQWFIETFFGSMDAVYEFGCGTGYNLLHVNKIYPKKKIFGSDFVQSSVDLVNEIARRKQIPLQCDLFNMLDPDPSYEVIPNSAIYTFGALEQLASNLDPILNFFISKNPSICIHTEPALELYEDDSVVDYLGKKFESKRGYSSGLIDKLKTLEAEGKIEIIKIKRLYFGSFFFEGYNLFIWKPKNFNKEEV